MSYGSSTIHYKFRTQDDYKTVSFDGLHVTVDEFRNAVFQAEGISRDCFDLKLCNASTKRVYEGSDVIPRNSSVDVARIPREGAAKMPKIGNTDGSGVINNAAPVSLAGHINETEFSQMTELDRLKHIQIVSTQKYNRSNYSKRPMQSNNKAPLDHMCQRCNGYGHFVKQCPMQNVRRTTGIPMEELMETTPDDPHAMLHPSGKYVVPIMHRAAREGRKLRDAAPVRLQEVKAAPPPPPPSELLCPLCKKVLRDALLTSCCGESFCATCIHEFLVKRITAEHDDDHDADKKPSSSSPSSASSPPRMRCPTCPTEQILSADSLVPNKKIREAVSRYLESCNVVTGGVGGGASPKSSDSPPLSLDASSATMHQGNRAQPSPSADTVVTILPPVYISANGAVMPSTGLPNLSAPPPPIRPFQRISPPISTISPGRSTTSLASGGGGSGQKSPYDGQNTATTPSSTTTAGQSPPVSTEPEFSQKSRESIIPPGMRSPLPPVPEAGEPVINLEALAAEEAKSKAWKVLDSFVDTNMDYSDLHKALFGEHDTSSKTEAKEKEKKHDDRKKTSRHRSRDDERRDNREKHHDRSDRSRGDHKSSSDRKRSDRDREDQKKTSSLLRKSSERRHKSKKDDSRSSDRDHRSRDEKEEKEVERKKALVVDPVPEETREKVEKKLATPSESNETIKSEEDAFIRPPIKAREIKVAPIKMKLPGSSPKKEEVVEVDLRNIDLPPPTPPSVSVDLGDSVQKSPAGQIQQAGSRDISFEVSEPMDLEAVQPVITEESLEPFKDDLKDQLPSEPEEPNRAEKKHKESRKRKSEEIPGGGGGDVTESKKRRKHKRSKHANDDDDDEYRKEKKKKKKHKKKDKSRKRHHSDDSGDEDSVRRSSKKKSRRDKDKEKEKSKRRYDDSDNEESTGRKGTSSHRRRHRSPSPIERERERKKSSRR